MTSSPKRCLSPFSSSVSISLSLLLNVLTPNGDLFADTPPSAEARPWGQAVDGVQVSLNYEIGPESHKPAFVVRIKNISGRIVDLPMRARSTDKSGYSALARGEIAFQLCILNQVGDRIPLNVYTSNRADNVMPIDLKPGQIITEEYKVLPGLDDLTKMGTNKIAADVLIWDYTDGGSQEPKKYNAVSNSSGLPVLK